MRARKELCAPILNQSQYKRLVRAVFPDDVESSEPLDAEMRCLNGYAVENPAKLAKIGFYIERRASKKFALGQYQHVQVAVQVEIHLIKTCRSDVRFIIDSALRLTRFLLHQTEAPNLQVIVCDLVVALASNIENSENRVSYEHKFVSFIADISTLCFDAESDSELSLTLRAASMRAMIAIVKVLGTAGLKENLKYIVPGVLRSMGDVFVGSEELGQRVRDTATTLLGEICQLLRPLAAPYFMKPFYSYLDDNKCWVSDNKAPAFALEVLQILTESMLPEYNYLIFTQMKPRIEACCGEDADPINTLSIVRAINTLARHEHSTASTSFFHVYVGVLDVLIASVETLKAANYTGHDESTIRQRAEDPLPQENLKVECGSTGMEIVSQIVEEAISCMGTMGKKFEGLADHPDALCKFAERCFQPITSVLNGLHNTPIPLRRALEAGWALEMVLRAFKAVVHKGIRSAGRLVIPRQIMQFLLSCASSRFGGARARELVVQALEELLCTSSPHTSAQRCTWHTLLNPSDLPLLVAALLDMACNEGNTEETVVHVHRLLVQLARRNPHAWVEVLMPPILGLHRLALKDSLEFSALIAHIAHDAAGSSSEGLQFAKERELAGTLAPELKAVESTSTSTLVSGVAVLQGGVQSLESERRRNVERSTRAKLSPAMCKWVHKMVTGTMLAVSQALPCAALEEHVRQVISESIQPGHESARLRISDNGDLKLHQIDESLHSGTSCATLENVGDSVCMRLLDASVIVDALAPKLPHLAHVLTAYGKRDGDWKSFGGIVGARLVRSGALSVHSPENADVLRRNGSPAHGMAAVPDGDEKKEGRMGGSMSTLEIEPQRPSPNLLATPESRHGGGASIAANDILLATPETKQGNLGMSGEESSEFQNGTGNQGHVSAIEAQKNGREASEEDDVLDALCKKTIQRLEAARTLSLAVLENAVESSVHSDKGYYTFAHADKSTACDETPVNDDKGGNYGQVSNSERDTDKESEQESASAEQRSRDFSSPQNEHTSQHSVHGDKVSNSPQVAEPLITLQAPTTSVHHSKTAQHLKTLQHLTPYQGMQTFEGPLARSTLLKVSGSFDSHLSRRDKSITNQMSKRNGGRRKLQRNPSRTVQAQKNAAPSPRTSFKSMNDGPQSSTIAPRGVLKESHQLSSAVSSPSVDSTRISMPADHALPPPSNLTPGNLVLHLPRVAIDLNGSGFADMLDSLECVRPGEDEAIPVRRESPGACGAGVIRTSTFTSPFVEGTSFQEPLHCTNGSNPATPQSPPNLSSVRSRFEKLASKSPTSTTKSNTGALSTPRRSKPSVREVVSPRTPRGSKPVTMSNTPHRIVHYPQATLASWDVQMMPLRAAAPTGVWR